MVGEARMQIDRYAARWLRLSPVTIALLLGGGCSENIKPPAPPTPVPMPSETIEKPNVPKPADESPIHFEEMTARLGVHFEQVSGNSSEKHFPAANGSGVAMFDYDNDSRMDLYFLTARHLPFAPGSPGPENKLFQNRGDFCDVSKSSGLALSLFCHGVADADFDNDGFIDLAITTYGGSILMRNNGDGTFTRDPDFQDDRWGSSAAAGDFDNDGDLDLYVTHYGIWSLETNELCGDSVKNIRTFCSPKLIPPAVHAYYENDGAGRLIDATERVGLTRDDGRGQGVIAADINLDGHLDLYVANDLCPNFLYFNDGKGAFRDLTELSGAGFDRMGNGQAGMGIECGDADRDGRIDLFVTNFSQEYNAYYQNLDQEWFLDKSHSIGLANDSIPEVGWGTRLADFDNDGWLDVFVTNGHIDDNIAEISPNQEYRQPARMWKNIRGNFQHINGNLGSYFERKHVGRGAAFGDLNDDGFLDIAINHVDFPAAVLINRSQQASKEDNLWIRFELIGRRCARDAVGTVIELFDDELPQPMIQQRTSGGSYLSAHDHRVLIGIGTASAISRAEIRWLSGVTTELRDLEACRSYQVIEPVRQEDPPTAVGGLSLP